MCDTNYHVIAGYYKGKAYASIATNAQANYFMERVIANPAHTNVNVYTLDSKEEAEKFIHDWKTGEDRGWIMF